MKFTVAVPTLFYRIREVLQLPLEIALEPAGKGAVCRERLEVGPEREHLQPQQTSTAVFRLKTLAGEVQSDSGEVAANAVECAPEV